MSQRGTGQRTSCCHLQGLGTISLYMIDIVTAYMEFLRLNPLICKSLQKTDYINTKLQTHSSVPPSKPYVQCNPPKHPIGTVAHLGKPFEMERIVVFIALRSSISLCLPGPRRLRLHPAQLCGSQYLGISEAADVPRGCFFGQEGPDQAEESWQEEGGAH